MFKFLMIANEIDLTIYNKLKSILFVIVLIASIIAIIKTISDKFYISKLLFQLLLTAVILFLVYKPDVFMYFGSVICEFAMDCIKDTTGNTGVEQYV